MAAPSIVLAAVAGTASFLSPCMVPVVPAFLARLGNVAVADRGNARVVFHALLFVFGFSLVFSTLGVVFEAAVAEAATEVRTWLARLAGLFIIGFGLHVAGLVELRGLNRGSGFPVSERDGMLATLGLGGAFAVTWTPCVGPILGSTFALAAASPGAAFPILLAYSVGLGVPFLLVSVVPARTRSVISGRGRELAALNRAFGVVMLGLGVLVFTQRLDLLGAAVYTLETL